MHWSRLAILTLSLGLSSSLLAAGPVPVSPIKKTLDGRCITKDHADYWKTKIYVAKPTLEACLASGGRGADAPSLSTASGEAKPAVALVVTPDAPASPPRKAASPGKRNKPSRTAAPKRRTRSVEPSDTTPADPGPAKPPEDPTLKAFRDANRKKMKGVASTNPGPGTAETKPD
ncbi:MAG: hypothetical protein R3E84_06850 [Pseudomonadales bacterium]